MRRAALGFSILIIILSIIGYFNRQFVNFQKNTISEINLPESKITLDFDDNSSNLNVVGATGSARLIATTSVPTTISYLDLRLVFDPNILEIISIRPPNPNNSNTLIVPSLTTSPLRFTYATTPLPSPILNPPKNLDLACPQLINEEGWCYTPHGTCDYYGNTCSQSSVCGTPLIPCIPGPQKIVIDTTHYLADITYKLKSPTSTSIKIESPIAGAIQDGQVYVPLTSSPTLSITYSLPNDTPTNSPSSTPSATPSPKPTVVTKPAAPINLKYNCYGGGTRITLRWDTVTDATGYEIVFDQKDGDQVQTKSSTRAEIDLDLKSNTNYIWKVAAKKDSILGDYSTINDVRCGSENTNNNPTPTPTSSPVVILSTTPKKSAPITQKVTNVFTKSSSLSPSPKPSLISSNTPTPAPGSLSDIFGNPVSSATPTSNNSHNLWQKIVLGWQALFYRLVDSLTR